MRDLASGALVDEADPGLGSLQGVQWLDEHDLLLLGDDGDLVTVTTDPDRLLDLVRGSLTRGLTGTECTAYGFEHCPTLAELRNDSPTVSEELRGTYELSWTAAELQESAVAYYEEAFAAPLDPAAVDALGDLAALVAGDYRFEFTDAAYRITRGAGGDEFCTGSVSTRGDRLLLSADRGTWCLDFHYVETGWELDGPQLRLPRDEFRGPTLDALLWTSKPLQRVG